MDNKIWLSRALQTVPPLGVSKIREYAKKVPKKREDAKKVPVFTITYLHTIPAACSCSSPNIHANRCDLPARGALHFHTPN